VACRRTPLVRRWSLRVAKPVLAATAAAAVLAGCGQGAANSGARTVGRGQRASPVDAALAAPDPLATTGSSEAGSWALVPMGRLDQPLNTFWQVFYRGAGSATWLLRTPAGVADNGGLVLAASGRRITVGFLASQLLRYSPLASAIAGSDGYTPGLVPAALTSVPDALSVSEAGPALALTGPESRAAVLASQAGLGGWTTLTTRTRLAASGALSACALGTLSAVVATSPPVIGGSCEHAGTVPIVSVEGGVVSVVGPSLPARYRTWRVGVERLVPDDRGLAALLELRRGRSAEAVAAWDPGGRGRWVVSSPLPILGPLVSLPVQGAGRFGVLQAGTRGLVLAAIADGSTSWHSLATPPTGTETVALGPGDPEAFVVDGSVLRVQRLVSGRWEVAETVTVPISYGSSG
jgi:hypothetical protein